MSLTGPSRPPVSGRANSLVVFLHGFGADGNDLIGLAEPLAPHLPDTMFHAPNAPSRCSVNPMGYQWFPIPYIDGSSEAEMVAGFSHATKELDAWLDHIEAETGIGPERTVLVGFSQGTMMSLHVAPRRARPVAAVVGFSGRLMASERLAAEALSKPPVLLVHGDADEVVPFESMSEAENTLRAAGFRVLTHRSQGIGHGIAPDGLGLALGFIKEALDAAV